MDIKLIVYDLDGTLLSDQKKITKASIDALAKLHELGYIIAIATGRHFDEIKSIFSKEIFAFIEFIICCDGQYIFRSDGTMEFEFPHLQVDLAKYICDTASGDLFIVTDTADFYLSRSIIRKIELKIIFWIKNKNNSRKRKAISNISCVYGAIEKIVSEVSCLINVEKLRSICSIHLSTDRNHYEIKGKDINKYSGILKVMQICGLDKENILFFGDDNNDEECFDNLKYCIAMGNAVPEVKKKAFYITSSNNEDGIIRPLVEFGLLKVSKKS